MITTSKTLLQFSMAAGVVGVALFWGGQLPLNERSSLVSSAEARIGRPLTPMSYAGVARRTTRRAVAVGAVAVGTAAVVAAPVVVAPACSQMVDVYGRIVTVCR